MSDDFSPVLKAVLGAAVGAACYSAFIPLDVAAGAEILKACGHGAAYKLGLAKSFETFAGYAAAIGAAGGCFSAVCSSSDSDRDGNSRGNDIFFATGLVAASGAAGASKGGLAMTAAQGAAAGATGAGAIIVGGIGLVLGGLIVGGTLYCFKEGAKGCINCFKVNKDGGEREVTRKELADALQISIDNARALRALNQAQAQQAVRATRVPNPAYTGPVVGQPKVVSSSPEAEA